MPTPTEEKVRAPGPRLGGGNEVAGCLERARRRNHEHIGRDSERNGRDEIARRVVAKLRVKRGGNGVRGAARQKRVAVGFGLCDRCSPDRSTGTRAVLDNDRLSELEAELLEHDARDDVGRASRGERDDGAERLLRPRLGLHDGGRNAKADQGDQNRSEGHRRSPLLHGHHRARTACCVQYIISLYLMPVQHKGDAWTFGNCALS